MRQRKDLVGGNGKFYTILNFNYKKDNITYINTCIHINIKFGSIFEANNFRISFN